MSLPLLLVARVGVVAGTAPLAQTRRSASTHCVLSKVDFLCAPDNGFGKMPRRPRLLETEGTKGGLTKGGSALFVFFP